MTIRQVGLSDIFNGKISFEPRAIIGRPVSYFEGFGYRFTEDQDDLDSYTAAALTLDGTTPVALMRHRGNPESTVTVLLPRGIDHVDAILDQVTRAFDLRHSALIWQAG